MIKYMTAVWLAFTMMASQARAAEYDDFLLDLQHRGFRYFWEQAHPETGMVYDRASIHGDDDPERDRVASIAAVGFGLTIICIGQERGWIEPEAAYERVLNTLKFLWDGTPNVHGFFYHFIDIETGERRWNSELSSIDTALLMAGVLTARQYYKGTEIEEWAVRLYDRVNWPWMMNERGVFSMGWDPDTGFLPYEWMYYSEHKILYILALGSRTHPIDPSVWHTWRREPIITFADKTFLACPPLFTHQYSQTWIDFRNLRDAYANYHHNSALATLAQRDLFVDLAALFPGFGDDLWGLTASDSPHGYKAWGGPPIPSDPAVDGTVTPYAPGGAIAFAPEESLRTLRHMCEEYGDSIYGKYAFAVAFNPFTGWIAPDAIGIDIGVTVMSAENHVSEFVWNTFGANPEIQRAMRLAGFHEVGGTLSDDEQAYLKGVAHDAWRAIESLINPATGLPYNSSRREDFTSLRHIGVYLTALVAAEEMGFITRNAARERVRKTLHSVRNLHTWHGMPAAWNSVTNLQPSPDDTWVSAIDAGVLAAALITVGQAFPEFADDAGLLIRAMRWDVFYVESAHTLLGGYDHAADRFNPAWTLPLRGADSALAVFLAVASEQAPPSLFESLDRDLKSRQHVQYFAPGWEGGGLFMQYLPGIWLDERGTDMERSARNFTFAQMRHAVENGWPAWGWSAGEAPGGEFLGWGALRDDIVAPYASMLAVEHYPREVVRNLQQLEALGGRHARYGFHDAVNLISGRHTDHVLMLNQGMAFLSLANVLADNVVRRHFQADPAVARARTAIADYREPMFAGESSLYLMDAPPPDSREQAQRSVRAAHFSVWESAEWITLTPADFFDSGSVTAGNAARMSFSFAWDDDQLYFSANVRTDASSNPHPPEELYKANSVELFVNAANNGLRWGDRTDAQFGFAVGDRVWEWFGGRHEHVKAAVTETDSGYAVRAEIPWAALGVDPSPGTVLQVSPALNSFDPVDGTRLKLNWNWQPAGPMVRLGRLELAAHESHVVVEDEEESLAEDEVEVGDVE